MLKMLKMLIILKMLTILKIFKMLKSLKMLKKLKMLIRARHAQIAQMLKLHKIFKMLITCSKCLFLITAKIFIKSNKSRGIFRDSVNVLVLRLLMVHIHLHTNLTVGEIAFQTWMKPYSCAPQHFHASVCRLADILLSTEKTE